MNESIMGIPTMVFWQLMPFVAVGVFIVLMVLLRLLERRNDVWMTTEDDVQRGGEEVEHWHDDQSWHRDHGNRAPHSTWKYNSGNYPGV